MGETVTRRGRRSLPVLAACLALLALPAAGCGDDDKEKSSRSSSTGGAAKGDTTVNIASFKFVPEDLKVKAGSKVTWINQDKAPHTAQTEDEVANGFDTDRLDLGEKKAITLDTPGKFEYFCIYHRFMTGTVEVVQ
jgi:plastocyanin